MNNFKTQFGVPAIPLEEFNRLSYKNGYPFEWVSDDKNLGIIDPSELIVAEWFEEQEFIVNDEFTSEFVDSYLDLAEIYRKEIIRNSLSETRIVNIEYDARNIDWNEKRMLEHLEKASNAVNRFYQNSIGALAYSADIYDKRSIDPESWEVYQRNNGPWCLTPFTANNPFCNASRGFPKIPHDVQIDYGKISDKYKGSLKEIAIELFKAQHYARYVEGLEELSERLLSLSRHLWSGHIPNFVGGNSFSDDRYFFKFGIEQPFRKPSISKANLSMIVGKVNHELGNRLIKCNEFVDDFQERLKSIMGEDFEINRISLEKPKFIDLMFVSGIQHSLVRAIFGSYDGDVNLHSNFYNTIDEQEEYLARGSTLFSEAYLSDLKNVYESYLYMIWFHEMTHGVTPRFNRGYADKKAESVMDEVVAQAGVFLWADEMKKQNMFSEEQFRQVCMFGLMYDFRRLSEGLTDPINDEYKSYAILSAIHFSYFFGEGSIWKNEDTNKYEINYERLVISAEHLIKDLLLIKDKQEKEIANCFHADNCSTREISDRFKMYLKEYIDYMRKGDGKILAHTDEIIEMMREFPFPYFKFNVNVERSIDEYLFYDSIDPIVNYRLLSMSAND